MRNVDESVLPISIHKMLANTLFIVKYYTELPDFLITCGKWQKFYSDLMTSIAAIIMSNIIIRFLTCAMTGSHTYHFFNFECILLFN